MKSPAAFARLGISDQIKELYRMVRPALAPSGPTIPTPPLNERVYVLKSTGGTIQWVEDTPED